MTSASASFPMLALGWLLTGCTSPPVETHEVNANATTLPPTPQPSAGPPAAAKPETLPPDAKATPAKAHAYDGQNFIVHEWGTLTSVVSSDGRLLAGLHHEDEDLPGFVADRMAQAQVTPAIVLQKMETPVTYFYSPTPRSVQVKVEFPHGLFTQWFPYVEDTGPPLYLERPEDKTSVVDPWISSASALPPACEERTTAATTRAFLNWGQVDVLAPGSVSNLPGPLGDTTWGFARQTQANPVQVQVAGKTYAEKFLFYRGTGTFVLPVQVAVKQDGVVATNTDVSAAMRSAFLLNVTPTGAGFVALGDIKAAGSLTAPLPAASLPHQDFADQLGQALAAALVADGLYADEAQAMVATWRRSYFFTPGPRLLYLLPASHTDAVIPLHIVPRPDQLHRTMVIRVELVSPALEQRLDAALRRLADPASHGAAQSELLAYGRFTQPYLTDAVARATEPKVRAAGLALLEAVRAQRRWRPIALE
ncbi:MAG: hypothetical protein SF187_20455 [Deltaproteobacteria bacterium]|nr:hypothetical protein [Deltaproteobacteria bacterium]